MKKSNQKSIELAIANTLTNISLSVSMALCHSENILSESDPSVPLNSTDFASTDSFTYDLFYADRKVARFISLDSLCQFTSDFLTEFSTLDSTLLSIETVKVGA